MKAVLPWAQGDERGMANQIGPATYQPTAARRSSPLLDARAYKKRSMNAGELVTAADLEAMLKTQGLAKRGVLPGDVVYVRTGWGEHWRDPDTEKFYYTKAPGTPPGLPFAVHHHMLGKGRCRVGAAHRDQHLRERQRDGPLVEGTLQQR